jgi:uncharacterized protein
MAQQLNIFDEIETRGTEQTPPPAILALNGMAIERRSFMTIFTRKEADGSDGRTVEGYAAVFNSETDIGGWYKEIIEPGAFDDALLISDCRALFNHNADHLLARQSAETLKLSADSLGLLYKFSSPTTSIGNDILVMMERGDLKESSFAFTVKEQEWKEEKDADGDWTYTRVIKKVEKLYDVSPVTYPAYADTTVAKRSFETYRAEHQSEQALEMVKPTPKPNTRSLDHLDLLRLQFG